MRTVFILLVAVLLSVGVTLAIVKNQAGAAGENAYQRIVRTGVIRCGYGVFAPYFTKDPSGQFGGIWYEYTEALGEHLGIKIDWTEEIGLGDVPAALQAGRIDMYCGGLWTAGKRVREVNFLKPSAYEPMLVYVRPDDHRFDKDVTAINSPDIRVSTIDGEGGGLTAAEDFPKARVVSLPQLANYADMFNQVVTNKADVVLASPSGAAEFIKHNPNSLRPLLDHPLRVYPVALAVKYGESDLRDMLNQAQDDVINNQTMAKIIAHNEINKGDFWQVATPYKTMVQP